jgi:hypothetical protein
MSEMSRPIARITGDEQRLVDAVIPKDEITQRYKAEDG